MLVTNILKIVIKKLKNIYYKNHKIYKKISPQKIGYSMKTIKEPVKTRLKLMCGKKVNSDKSK